MATRTEHDLSTPGPDEVPHGLDWSKARRAGHADWYRRTKAASFGATIVLAHLDDGREVYEAYHEQRLLGRFETFEAAREHARQRLSVGAEA
jgi:hypothetical protein